LWTQRSEVSNVGIKNKEGTMKDNKLTGGPGSESDEEKETGGEEQFNVDEVKLCYFAS
jgi:hypothetical protein